MSLIDIDTNYSNNLPNILMSYNTPNSIEKLNSKSQKTNNSSSPHQLVAHRPAQLTENDQQVDKLPNLRSYNSNKVANSMNSGPGLTQYNQTFNSSSASNYSYNLCNDANRAFDNVVFDIFKVDPDDIAGQLTLIDLPLFKQIQPDELISCKWMSREKLIKAPNIVQFTRRFNQTTFWCQSEILNCKRIETRGKMITIFIKMAKRLYELHSFNSLMAIIVALKAQPIHRLKKTWTPPYVSKRDLATFERLADMMFDTNENKRKIRDIQLNCKLPCIPFLGLFLTDLIHIDIAHPHNSFDNPQRRNQMNNICRLISEYQQSNYQDLTSLSCDCCFSVINTELPDHQLDPNNQLEPTPTTESKCLVSNCSCLIHHGHVNGSGIINNDGTIYINDIGYIKNYLNSFLYIEELQRFKEEENYRDSLELEPDEATKLQANSQPTNSYNTDNLKKPIIHVSPSSPCKLSAKDSVNGTCDLKNNNKLVCMDTNNNSNYPNNDSGALNSQHRKSQSIASNMFTLTNSISEKREFLNNLKLKHPLDESIENSSMPESSTTLPNINNITDVKTTMNNMNQTTICNVQNTNDLINEIPLTLLQQKQLLANVKINDPSSLLRELLKHRHNNSALISNQSGNNNKSTSSSSHHHSSSFKNKFNCYSSSSADVDDDSDDEQNSDFDEDPMNNSVSIDSDQQNLPTEVTENINSTPIKLFNLSLDGAGGVFSSQKSNKNDLSSNQISNKHKKSNKAKKKLLNSTLKSDKISSVIGTQLNGEIHDGEHKSGGRNLINSLTEDFDTVDSSSVNKIGHNNSRRNTISKTSSSSDLFQTNHLPNLSGVNDETSLYTTHDLSGIANLSSVLALEQQLGFIMFESPVKRKCIMKNSRKPRFSQWKSYWLQLIGGNLLMYYPMKAIMFNANHTSNKNEQNSYIEELISNQTENTQDNPDIHQLHQEMQQQQKKERLQSHLQQKKIFYNKNPCKMHHVANWMVVNSYQDKEDEIIEAARKISANSSNNNQHSFSHNKQIASNLNLNSQHFSKFDIQLNDVDNGNMYKYRFDSLQLAKEWFEQFKFASTYHEREKPDNLIRFD